MKKVCVVIPAYKEKENLVDLIPAVFEELPKAYVLVVNDDSGDGSEKLVKRLQKKYSKLKLIHRKGKGGRGSAVMAGLLKAKDELKVEVSVEMDADFSHLPSELPSLIAGVRRKQVVLASRYLKNSRIEGWSMMRVIISSMANKMIRRLLGLPMRDNTNGFRGYSRHAVEVLLKHEFVTNGYIVLSEAAYLLTKNGFVFKELETVFVNRVKGESNTTVWELWHAFWGVWLIRKRV